MPPFEYSQLGLVPSTETYRLTCQKMILAEFKLSDRLFLKDESGSGKTTLLKRLVGLLRDPGDQIEIGSSVYSSSENSEVRDQLVLLQQQTFGTRESLHEQLTQWALMSESKAELITNRAKLLLEHFQKPHLLDKATENISGGERQVIQIVKAFVLRPKFLILDEPTGAMDFDLRNKIEKFIGESPLGFLWVTHEPDQIHRVGGCLLKIHEFT